MKYDSNELNNIASAMELMDDSIDGIIAFLDEMGHDKEDQITMTFEILMNAASNFATQFIGDDKTKVVEAFDLLYELHSADLTNTTKN